MFLDCSMKRLLLLLLLFTNEIAFSQTYVPKNNAALAVSEECWDKWTAAVSAKDYAAGDILREQNCILVYNFQPPQFNSHLIHLYLLTISYTACSSDSNSDFEDSPP